VIPLEWDEVAALRLGRLERGADDGIIAAIKADSRVVGPGDLFVALNTGVDFVADARSRGAATLIPDDQNAALATLAKLVRGRSEARVVAVVGSTGKTTTKDILGALCAAAVPTVFPEASLNNEIGVPLTVCRLESDTEVLVVEMGMRGLGQIAELCSIARPDVAVITSIGPEHLELVGSIENVARANAEVLDALPPGGVAVVPTADAAPALLPYLTRADIVLRPFDPRRIEVEDRVAVFALEDITVGLRLPYVRRSLVENTYAALLAYEALGLPLERLQRGIDEVRPSPWRGEEVALPGGGLVVNDAYNANPASMRAALVDLAERAGGRRKVAILGEMAELGSSAERYHREIGELVATTVDVLIAVGEPARAYMLPGVAEMLWVEHARGLDDAILGAVVRPGDAVLVKASRAVGLEGIPGALAKIAQTW
jgi:UDP-N-acetylmuramoyl-tripeptide--D-alanyl-D-alanine ligase